MAGDKNPITRGRKTRRARPDYLSARASPKGERAAGVSIQSCGIFPIFSEMAGLIMTGLYTGNDQYVGENVKFIK